jgi:hypothetical protein
MRKIDASKWIGSPNLQVISTPKSDVAGMNDFILNAKQLTNDNGESQQ